MILNVIVSSGLVTGWGPFPELGWKGLAIGTAVGHAVGGLILLAVLFKGRAGLRWSIREWFPSWSTIKRILKIGLPGGFDIATLLFSQLIFLAIINSLGKAAAAAHGLAVQIEACAFLPGAAFQVAAATMVGQYLGANLPDRANRGAILCLGFGQLIMCAAAAFMWFAGQWMAYCFTGDLADPTTQATADLLKVIAIAMPSLAVVIILTGALRGAGDTVWPFVFTLIGFMVIRIPLAIYLCPADSISRRCCSAN